MAIRVESGRVTGIVQTGVEVTVAAFDVDRTFVKLHWRGNEASNQGPHRWSVRCHVAPGGDNTKIRFAIGDSDNPTDAVGEATYTLVEALNEEFRVEHILDTLGDASEDVDLTTVNEFGHTTLDPARTMVTASWRATYTGDPPTTSSSESVYPALYLTDGDTLRAERTNDLLMNCGWSAMLVEWSVASGVTVESGQVDDTFNSTIESTTLGSDVDDNLTWLLATFKHFTGSLLGCSARLEIDFTANELDRMRHDSNSARSLIAYDVVRFPSGKGVRCAQGVGAAGSTDATAVITLNREVKAASSLVFITNSCPGTGAGFARHIWTHEFTSIDGGGMSSEITVDRDYNANACAISAFVLDLSEAELLPAAGQNLMLGHWA